MEYLNPSMLPKIKTDTAPSSEEYIEQERQADYKSEFAYGIVYAMSGASEKHNLIVVNLITEIGRQFKKRPCRVYANGMKVRVKETNYVYPDVVALCGEAKFADNETDVLLNPTAVIEVLSESTTNYDRGKKFELYRRLESLQEYILIAQDSCYIEYHLKQGRQWLLTEFEDIQDMLILSGIGCELLLEDIYDKVLWNGSS